VWGLLASADPSVADVPAPVAGLERIEHIIVVVLENRSFDNLYGLFPGANGIANAGEAGRQTDRDGKPFAHLPPVKLVRPYREATVDGRFPTDLPNGPFRADRFVGIGETTGDLVHRFYQEQLQINGGRMDRFAAWSDAGGLTMSIYDASRMPLWRYARDYVLADNFFHGAFGGSFLNHIYLVCACVPEYKDAPEILRAKIGPDGSLVRDGAVTPDGFAVNTLQPRGGPHARSMRDESLMLPTQEAPHIGDRLDAKGVTWAWYSGGWDDAVAGRPDPEFQFHHQPMAYFKSTALGTPGAKAHLKDEQEFAADILTGKLPQVSFIKPIGEDNEHPGYATITSGEQHTRDLIGLVEKSPYWDKSLIIITYDENGGLWDHVAPPKVDRWGPGTRIPTLIIGPRAKRGFVDHTVYDTVSILKLIETRFGLEPLGRRDAAAADMTNALDLGAGAGK